MSQRRNQLVPIVLLSLALPSTGCSGGGVLAFLLISAVVAAVVGWLFTLAQGSGAPRHDEDRAPPPRPPRRQPPSVEEQPRTPRLPAPNSPRPPSTIPRRPADVHRSPPPSHPPPKATSPEPPPTPAPERPTWAPPTPDPSDAPARVLVRSGSHGSSVVVLAGREPARKVAADGRWLGPGTAVKVGGYTIACGMLYVGRWLESVSGYEVEPSLVHLDLPVDRQRIDRSGDGLSYWPSYSNISPGARAAYLEWLATGRRAPGVNIGYVFLFFYGLERRVLIDHVQGTLDKSELLSISHEVEQLLAIYSDNRSFRGYAGTFLSLCRVLLAWDSGALELPPIDEFAGEVPYEVKVGLGQRVLAGQPIPPDWALAWVCNTPNSIARRKTSVSRCREEFIELFRIRYAERYGDGMLLKPNKTLLKLEYRAASGSFPGPAVLKMGELPDVTALRRPVQELEALVEQCAVDLDPFSRWVGKHGADGVTIAGAALLPEPLLRTHMTARLAELRTWLRATTHGGRAAVVTGSDLMTFWPGSKDDKLTKTESVGLVQLADKLGYGVEPDPRFGGPTIEAAAPAVVFPLPSGAPSAASPEYGAATLLLHLASVVAAADGTIDATEEQHLSEHLEAALHLSEAERTRLAAHLKWLMGKGAGLAGLKKRIETLGRPERDRIAVFLVGVAGADGHISKAEVRSLEKIYASLGFDSGDLYRNLNALGASGVSPTASEPVTVKPAGARANGSPIPAPPTPGAKQSRAEPADDGPEFFLDMASVKQKLAETAAVSSLLAGIFTEDDEPAPQPSAGAGAVAQAPSGRVLDGLDLAHSSLVLDLAGQDDWSREAWEALCARHSVFPDGALETLNEMAFDRFGEPLVEGDDPIEVNQDLLRELVA